MPQARQPKRHLLVVTRFNPLGGFSGSGTYLCSILGYLHRNGLRISLCWSERPEAAAHRGWWIVPRALAEIADLSIPGAVALGRLRVFPGVWTGPLRAALRGWGKQVLVALGLRKASPQAPAAPAVPAHHYQWDRTPDPYEVDFFGEAVARLKPDAILFNYCWMTPLADRFACPNFTLTHDLRHLFSTLVNGRIVHTEGELMSQARETEYLAHGGGVIAIRKDDAERFRKLLPGKEVLVANPSILPCPSDTAPIPGRCLFVAADNTANREGLEWFLRNVWPHVRAAHPEAELHLCGTICRSLLHADPPGVIRRGFVEDLGAVYGEASLVVVPLLRGTGVKIKLMEALAHGKACVSTPIGTEGVPVLETCVRVVDSAVGFTEAVNALLADPAIREKLEVQALATIRERFSPETCYRPLLDALLR